MHTRHTRHTSVSYGGQDETEKQAEEEEDEGKREAPGKAEQGDGERGERRLRARSGEKEGVRDPAGLDFSSCFQLRGFDQIPG